MQQAATSPLHLCSMTTVPRRTQRRQPRTTTSTSAAIIDGHRWWQGLHFNVSWPSATNQVVNYAKVVNCISIRAPFFAALTATIVMNWTLNKNQPSAVKWMRHCSAVAAPSWAILICGLTLRLKYLHNKRQRLGKSWLFISGYRLPIGQKRILIA